MANSKVEVLKAEASGLRKDLITAMDVNKQIKSLIEHLESKKLLVKQKDEFLASSGQRMKDVVAKAIHAFQTTKEYNAILFQWYFKGFELLRRYMIKHGPGMDLEELDFEVVDKEIEADEAAQAATSTGEDLETGKDDGDAPQA